LIAENWIRTRNYTGQLLVKSCGCQSKWCPKCRTHEILKWSGCAVDRIRELGGDWVSLVLTLDRERFPEGPQAAYERLLDERAVGQFTQTLRRHGVITGRCIGFLEWQDGLWVHWHLVVQLEPQAAEALNTAYRERRGQGVIDWKDENIAPAWSHGFTSAGIIRDLKKQVCYACAYGAKKKQHQLDLPKWVGEFLESNGRKTIPKLWTSRGQQSFWNSGDNGAPISINADDLDAEEDDIDDDNEDACDCDEEPLCIGKPRRPVTVVIENCGKERCVVGVEVAEDGYMRGEWGEYVPMGGKAFIQAFLALGGQAEVINAERQRWRIDPEYVPFVRRVIREGRATRRRCFPKGPSECIVGGLGRYRWVEIGQ
jgi:hypothetical protein